MKIKLYYKTVDSKDEYGCLGTYDWNKIPQMLYPDNYRVKLYTNIKDRYDNEVYEGDIVTVDGMVVEDFTEKDVGTVIFKDYRLGIKFDDDIGNVTFEDITEFLEDGVLCGEVIGNIYQGILN